MPLQKVWHALALVLKLSSGVVQHFMEASIFGERMWSNPGMNFVLSSALLELWKGQKRCKRVRVSADGSYRGAKASKCVQKTLQYNVSRDSIDE